MTVVASMVIYQGNKYFWKTRNTIDVAVVKHANENVIEIIAYEPSLDVEASRIYMNFKTLITKLDHEAIAAKMSLAKQSNVPHTEQFVDGVMNGAISDFILSRLFIEQFSKEERIFEIQLQFTFSDNDGERGADIAGKLLCDKPAALSPHTVIHHKTPSPGVVDAALLALEEEKRNLKENCDKAQESQAQTAVVLGVKERWRIPIILARIDKGVPLTEEDAKIWAVVSHNTSIQKDAINDVLRSTTAANTAPKAVVPPSKTVPNTLTSRRPTPRMASVVLAARSQMAYMEGTTTSESRSKAAAKEREKEKAAAAADKEKAVRKLAKHGSKSKSKSATKGKARKSNSRGRSGSSLDDSDYEHEECLVESPVGLVSHLVSSLASLSASVKASVSGKRSNKVYVEATADPEDIITTRVSPRGSAKGLGDTLVERFKPPASRCNSGLMTSRSCELLHESLLLSGDCTPTYPLSGDYSMGASCFSNDDAGCQLSQLEGADSSEITSAPTTHRQFRFSSMSSVADEEGGSDNDGSVCTKSAPHSSKKSFGPAKPTAVSTTGSSTSSSKAKANAKSRPPSNNQVRFNEVTGMYERQLTAPATHSKKQRRLPSFSQALDGVIQATANLRASLTFDGQQSIGEMLRRLVHAD